MLLHLPSSGRTAHGHVLYRSAKAGHLVAFEVAYGYHDIRIGYGTADLRLLDVITIYQNFDIIITFDPVTDDDVAAERLCSETIGCSTIQMVGCLLPLLDEIAEPKFSITDFYVDNAARLRLRSVLSDCDNWVDAGKPEALERAAQIIVTCYE